MEKFSIREVVEQAVQTEKLGYDFYSRMSKKFAEEGKFKKLFDALAAMERQHEKLFLELRDKVEDHKTENPEEVSAYLRAIVESEFFLGKNKSLPSLEHLKSFADAVTFALGFEKETLLYYYGMKDVVKEKELVNEIIEEEKSHIRWLSEFKKKS
jgi:rubrerythrin